jgi:hypothetical protein
MKNTKTKKTKFKTEYEEHENKKTKVTDKQGGHKDKKQKMDELFKKRKEREE